MLLLAAIADDYTGGSDLAGMLAAQGVRTLQTFGLPDEASLKAAADADVIVVSLKSRSIPAQQAVDRSLQALRALQTLRPRQIQFKYCSTFDSTPEGNIGPVTSALMEAMRTPWTIAVPALPVNGRTQYLGHLFVNEVLLSESPLRNHPLNPMTEPNLVRHLQAQTTRRAGLIDLPSVRRGAIQRPADGTEIALVDAIDDADLQAIARATIHLPLITGGSGITAALPAIWRDHGLWPGPQPATARSAPLPTGRVLMLAGSCSAATLRQIDEWKGPKEAMRVDALGPAETARLVDWCRQTWRGSSAVLLYSSAQPGQRHEGSSGAIEQTFADIALRLLCAYDRIVVAGGETSGAVVEALGVTAVEIGQVIDPGVPALRSVVGPTLGLALKSGNFGAPDFFRKASGIIAP